MADPTMQTFCCHRSWHRDNETDTIGRIMYEFNPDAYNIVCLFSAGLGIIGAVYQILPRHQFVNNHRWSSESAHRGRRIIVWLAVADLLASLGLFVRAALWLNFNVMPATSGSQSVLFCAFSSAWTQYFYTATWIWTLCYAIDMRRVLSEREPRTICYHLAAWTIPALTTTLGLSILYLPDAKCRTTQTLSNAVIHILPNYLATYIPILSVMLINPYLYRSSSVDMQRIITGCFCQLTSRERDIMDAIKIKFAVINIVFYICWLPNLINGTLLWFLWFHLPARLMVAIWYIMAFTNPLQALFNCLVYRRWRKGREEVIFPWNKRKYPTLFSKALINIARTQIDCSIDDFIPNEAYPLLRKS